MRAQVAFSAQAETGEGPVWDVSSNALHWVDIPAGEIHTSEPGSGQTLTLSLDTMVGAVALTETGGLVVACAEGFGLLHKGEFDLRLPFLTAAERMNDGKCDPAGRFWAGSTHRDFTAGGGALHMLGADWQPHVALTGLTLPNGLGWTADGSTFYLVDSLQQVIFAFDFDVASGALSGQRILRSFADTEDLPDGLCLDAEDFLWVAMWGGSRVLRISAAGDIVARIDLPVTQPSSCAFGGSGLDTLYVTSARGGLASDLAADAPDGSVFSVTDTGVTGLPPARFGG